jgi:hypothetical protein
MLSNSLAAGKFEKNKALHEKKRVEFAFDFKYQLVCRKRHQNCRSLQREKND